MGRYVLIADNSFFLKRVFKAVAAGEPHMTAAEIAHAEDWSANKIDEFLGLIGDPFPALPDTPVVIQDIALLLSASRIRRMLLAGNAPNVDQHTDRLEQEALVQLRGILHGVVGVRMKDGTPHPIFSGPTGGERFAKQAPEASRRFHIQTNLPFERMDHLTDEEKPETDKFSDPLYTEEVSTR